MDSIPFRALVAAAAALIGVALFRAPAVISEADGEADRGRALAARRAVSLARLAAKEDATDAVAAGRLTVEEAAARFRKVDDADPAFNRSLFRAYTPGGTDAERYRHAVLRRLRLRQGGRAAPPPAAETYSPAGPVSADF